MGYKIAFISLGCAKNQVNCEQMMATVTAAGHTVQAVPEGADVVVVDDDAQPLVLCECKAPEIPIDRHVLAQAVRYNSVLGARYLVLTNGRSHYCYELVEGEYRQCDRFPSIGSGMGD